MLIRRVKILKLKKIECSDKHPITCLQRTSDSRTTGWEPVVQIIKGLLKVYIYILIIKADNFYSFPK